MSNTQWKEFKIGDLFEIKVGKQPPIGNRHDTKEEGFVNTITGVTLNNGVGFYSKPYSDIYINELTMAKDGEYAGKVFLQRDEFCLGGHSLGLLMGSDVSNDSKLYLATLLNGLQSKGQWQNSTYINSVTLKELKEILIPLPVTPEGTPDWSYMESYIRDKQERVKLRLDQLTSIDETPKTLVYSALNRGGVSRNTEWKEFRVGDLFSYERGKESSPKRVDDGNIPMIAEINTNNGVAKFGSSPNIIKGNSITISVNFAENVYYQENDFIASVNVIVIRNKHLNRWNGRFIETVLRANNKKYNYVNKISKQKLRDEIITLPATSSGYPDYDYMEEYIRVQQGRVKERLDALESMI